MFTEVRISIYGIDSHCYSTAAVKEEIKLILRMNRPNVTLKIEELEQDKSKPQAVQFASKVAEIISSDASIIYTDLLADIGPMVSALYRRLEWRQWDTWRNGYSNQTRVMWKSGMVKTIIVETKEFGMGIDKANIRHVIRNVPESMLSWAQEFGRAGRDGHQACATILYRKSDISHANSWILNNLSDQDRYKQIISDFSDSWQYINAHLISGMCRRRLLMDMFSEETNSSNASGDCCDVYMHKNSDEAEYTDHI